MCGIAGIIQTNCAPVSPDVLVAMTSALSHRGPDGWGTQIWHGVGLGHRRLAIIDPKGGKQPLSNENEQVWITFNGEIYNYRELRHDLRLKGHLFRTNSDTETIVHAYEQWGDRCVERLRGMFAFAIVDLKQRRVLLARDHLGIKPLYYLQSPTYFAFASELKALQCIPNQLLDLDLQAIDQYLWLQYIPAPQTAFKQVKKLLPAHRMAITFDGRLSDPDEYWHLEFRPNYQRGQAEWIQAIDEVLRDSVRAHLVSDVPFGAFLSGGVDSSAVVAYMAQLLDQPVRTFSIGFKEEDFNELPHARKVAEQWGTTHRFEIVEPNALEILPRLVRHYGEPFGDSSAIPTYYVSQLARCSVPMVLSGDGGDEAFAGYESYRLWMQWLTHDGSASWKRLMRPFVETIMPRRYPPRKPTMRNWLEFIAYVDVPRRKSLWRPDYRGVCPAPLKTHEELFARTLGYPPCTMAQYMDLKTYLPYDILTKVDVASMMHGLEARTPLTDVRVIEFAATIPDTLNINRNDDGRWEGKLLLKKTLEKYYSKTFLHRSKMGFALPIQPWFATDGAFRPIVRERLLGTDSMLSEFFEPDAIASLMDLNATGPMWLLLFLDEWLRQNRNHVSLSNVIS